MEKLKNEFVFGPPKFRIEDLKLVDLEGDICVDPLNKIRQPIEPERLCSIYQQAFIFDLLYKFAKDYLPNVKDENNVKSVAPTEKTTDTTIDSIKDKVIEYLFRNENKKPDLLVQENDDDPPTNIWNTDDLKILRQNFSDIKENNILLVSQTKALEDENRMLKDRLARLELETRHTRNERITLEQENERLYIRMSDVESRFALLFKQFDEYEEEKKRDKKLVAQLKQQVETLKNDKYKLEFDLNKNEQLMSSLKHEQKLFYAGLIEKIKLKFHKQIHMLMQQLAELNEKYAEKRLSCDKAQKALDHLRKHFMTTTYQISDKISDNLIK